MAIARQRRTEEPLWLTVRGASVALAAGWVAWTAAAALAGPGLAAALGPPRATLVVLAAGWFLARRLAPPAECLRRYHVDDTELVAMGPGRAVRRLSWSAVRSLTQMPNALRLEGEGVVVRLPLGAVVGAGAWGRVLAHVVPALADEMWAQLEGGGQVELVPALDPPSGALASWAWVPALAASLGASGRTGVALLLALVVAERAVAVLRARRGTIALHRVGAGLRFRLWRFLVAWPRIDVLRVPGGLVLAALGRTRSVGAHGLPNFWAAAPVIEMKAHLGPRSGATVHFRVRLAEDGPAVVGEVDSV
ncbi:MAG TPA: hypothetical protein VFD84_16360 [Candidatus Binatia bacterium]|jgi:hypothetical protein|nr:hypothetical protein [Candidatus Binatia bacterium]